MRKLILATLAMAVMAKAATALLLPITFEHFAERANCAFLVEVVSIEEVEDSDLTALEIPEAERQGLNRLAHLRVLTNVLQCESAVPDSPLLVFSTEVHSSHPKVDQRYVLFPRPLGKAWAEVLYGRSLWETNTEGKVLLSWRNDFLVEPLHLEAGETAFVPWAAVERLLVDHLVCPSQE